METDDYIKIVVALNTLFVILMMLAVGWLIAHPPHAASQIYITQEQTPFQWYCPEQPVNCSTVVPVVTVNASPEPTFIMMGLNEIYTGYEPPNTPVPTIIPVTTTTMPVPEFPFLHG